VKKRVVVALKKKWLMGRCSNKPKKCPRYHKFNVKKCKCIKASKWRKCKKPCPMGMMMLPYKCKCVVVKSKAVPKEKDAFGKTVNCEPDREPEYGWKWSSQYCRFIR